MSLVLRRVYPNHGWCGLREYKPRAVQLHRSHTAIGLSRTKAFEKPSLRPGDVDAIFVGTR